MARGGLDRQDYLLALYALVKALSLQPGDDETNVLLSWLDYAIDKSWRNKTFGVEGLLKNLLSRDPSQQPSWSLIQTMRTLEADVFEDLEL